MPLEDGKAYNDKLMPIVRSAVMLVRKSRNGRESPVRAFYGYGSISTDHF